MQTQFFVVLLTFNWYQVTPASLPGRAGRKQIIYMHSPTNSWCMSQNPGERRSWRVVLRSWAQ